MQTSWGDQSPVIEAGGNVSVTYGLDEERIKAMLERQQEELFRKLRESNVLADDGERRLLEQQLQAVSAKLADIERSYEEELARRKAADAALAQLRGQLPEAQLENAQASLRQGDKDAAKSVFHGVLDKEGASVALAAYQLGQMAESDLNYAEAMRMYKKAVVLEDDNPEYLLAAGKLAREMAEYKQAQEWLEHLLEIKTKKRNEVDIAIVQCELSILYCKQGMYDKAEDICLKALAIKDRLFIADNIDIGAILNNLAEIYRHNGRYEEAECLYKHDLAATEKKLGEKHPEVAIILSNIAGLYQLQGRYKEAENLYIRSLTIKESAFGKDHYSSATTLNNLALLYKKEGRYDQAELLFARSLSIKEVSLGKDHPDVAITLYNLAVLFFEKGDYLKAYHSCGEAVNIMKKNSPAGHYNLDIMQKSYDMLKQKMAEQSQ